MQLPNQNQIPEVIPLLFTGVLHNGNYTLELDSQNRSVLLHFSPVGMPFFRFTIPMPSLAFTQFYMACKAMMDRLSNESEEIIETQD